MDYREVQKKLEALYSDWKATLRLSDEEADSLFPPYLLSVTEDYCRADRRVLVYGQETGGWGWDEAEQAKRAKFDTVISLGSSLGSRTASTYVPVGSSC